jgi:hypothetical protein
MLIQDDLRQAAVFKSAYNLQCKRKRALAHTFTDNRSLLLEYRR